MVLKNNKVKISIVAGLIIGAIIGSIVKSMSDIHRGPNSNTIRKHIYIKDDQCHQLDPVVLICPISKSMAK